MGKVDFRYPGPTPSSLLSKWDVSLGGFFGDPNWLWDTPRFVVILWGYKRWLMILTIASRLWVWLWIGFLEFLVCSLTMFMGYTRVTLEAIHFEWLRNMDISVHVCSFSCIFCHTEAVCGLHKVSARYSQAFGLQNYTLRMTLQNGSNSCVFCCSFSVLPSRWSRAICK